MRNRIEDRQQVFYGIPVWMRPYQEQVQLGCDLLDPVNELYWCHNPSIGDDCGIVGNLSHENAHASAMKEARGRRDAPFSCQQSSQRGGERLFRNH